MIHRQLQYLKGLFKPDFRPPSLFKASLIFIILATAYWGLIASDRYVSEACIVIDRTEIAGGQGTDFVSLITGGNRNNDLMLLREHLRSVDMLNKLDGKLGLRSHYSNKQYDLISRNATCSRARRCAISFMNPSPSSTSEAAMA